MKQPLKSAKENNFKKRGYVAIITVLIISVVTLFVALSVSLLGIDSGETSLAVKKGDETRYLTEACVENAIYQIKNNPSYSGETLPLFNGSCTTIANLNGGLWTVTATGTKDNYTKKIQAIFSLNGSGEASNLSWQEIQ